MKFIFKGNFSYEGERQDDAFILLATHLLNVLGGYPGLLKIAGEGYTIERELQDGSYQTMFGKSGYKKQRKGGK